MDDVTEDELCDGFAEQAIAIENGEADAVCIETMTALDEASCAINAIKENIYCEIACTFTFDKSKDGISPNANQ